MKTNFSLHRMIFAALGFMLLLLTGCGGGDSSSTAKFVTDLVAGKTYAFANADGSVASGTLAFNADSTWRSAPYSGTWKIDAEGRLVTTTTVGGDDTITYTLLDSTAGGMKVSAVEVNPSEPTKPKSYTTTFLTAFTAEMIAGQKFSYVNGSGATASNGVIEFGSDGAWKTTTDTATYSGTWSVVAGKLVAVTKSGGDHTVTYTRLNANANPLSASASEVSPAAPNSPVISTVTFTP